MIKYSVTKTVFLTALLLFLMSRTVNTQICSRYNLNTCVQCPSQYTLVDGHCQNNSERTNSATPNAIFNQSQAIQQLLGGTLGSTLQLKDKQTDSQVPIMKVIPLNIGQTVGNYYQLQLENGTIPFTQLVFAQATRLSNQTNQNATNKTEGSEGDGLELVRVQGEKKGGVEGGQIGLNLTHSKLITQSANNSSVAQNSTDLQLTPASKASNATETTQMYQATLKAQNSTLTKVQRKQAENQTDIALNLTAAKPVQQNQQIELNLSKAKKNVTVQTPLTLTPIAQKTIPQENKNNQKVSGGTITLNLTPAAQQLIAASQQLTKINKLQATPNSSVNEQKPAKVAPQQLNLSLTPSKQLQLDLYPTTKVAPLELTAVSRSNQSISNADILANLVKASKIELIDYVAATRLYSAVKSTQPTKCYRNLTLYQPPKTSNSPLQINYNKFLQKIEKQLTASLTEYFLADTLMICVDPFMEAGLAALIASYRVLSELRLWRVYYCFCCGFGQNFIFWWVDDRSLPVLKIYKSVVVVDRLRMYGYSMQMTVFDSTDISSSP